MSRARLPRILNHERRHVVILGCPAREGLDVLYDAVEQRRGVGPVVLADQLDETVLAELLAMDVQRFGDAIAVDHDHITTRKLLLDILIRRVLEKADRHAARREAAQAT